MAYQSTNRGKLIKQVSILFLVVLALGCYSVYKNRQIPFDSQQWKEVKRSQLNIRYRMKDDLLRQLKSKKTLSEVMTMLGKSGGSEQIKSNSGTYIRCELGRKYYGPIALGQYYLGIQFDENDQLTDVGIYPY